jgi:hypothetical protein
MAAIALHKLLALSRAADHTTQARLSRDRMLLSGRAVSLNGLFRAGFGPADRMRALL